MHPIYIKIKVYRHIDNFTNQTNFSRIIDSKVKCLWLGSVGIKHDTLEFNRNIDDT